MESSEAEQSAPSCSVTVKCEPAIVKEEPEWGECGVSEAAVAEGLYAGHAVKDELVIAPKRMQQLDIASSVRDVFNIKEENQHEAKPAGGADAVAEGLYAGREVKYELDIGPELVQQQDIAYSIQDVLNNEYERKHKPKPAIGADAAPGYTHPCPGEGPRCNRSPEQQHGLKSCFVRLELPVEGLRMSAPFNVSRDCGPSYCLMPPKLKPAHCSVGTSRAREAPTSHQPHPSDEQSTNSSDFPNHVQTHTHKKPHSCKICCKQFTLQSNLARHILIHSAEKPYGCDVCNKSFIEKSKLSRHVLLHTKDKPYRCNICHQQFRRQPHLIAHVRKHTGEKPYSCDVCKKQFRDKWTLAKHIQIHSDVKLHSCDVCNKQFRKKSDMLRHAKIHTVRNRRTREVPASCQPHPSNEQSTNKSDFPNHVQTHKHEKQHSCKICCKQFTQRSNLTRHIKIHAADKSYECDVCSKRFRDKWTLTQHIQKHSDGKQHSCNICNKLFTRKSNLNRHMIVHTDKKPYSCGVCSERFRHNTALTAHLRIHTGEKPYSCEVCNKQFRQKSTLDGHMIVHTDKKPYRCEVCNKRFRHKSNLEGHKHDGAI